MKPVISRICLLLLCALWLAGCTESQSAAEPAKPGAEGAPTKPTPSAKPGSSPTPTAKPGSSPTPTAEAKRRRVIAIGDVHGDLAATRRVLQLAGLIDAQDRWMGGKTRVVQTGDVLDRGDDERAILELFKRLKVEAKAAGGEFLVLNGNHELMNVAGDLRYVTPGGFKDFEGTPGANTADPRLSKVPEAMRARVAAFIPGGPYALALADQPAIAVVEGSVFAHGGVLMKHVEYGVERINEESRQWLLGKRGMPPSLNGDDSPVWTRIYSVPEPTPEACQELSAVLAKLGAQRMIVGHTPQQAGITSACDGKVWRVDVGMAKHYGGSAAALEIVSGKVIVLK